MIFRGDTDYLLYQTKEKTPNEVIKMDLIIELLNFLKITKPNDALKKIINNNNLSINDILEFHRDLHAENGAIVEAARLGKCTENTTMYVTTFPCHICSKNIIGAGIKRVVFIEPYQKSRSKGLYGKSIEGFEPFFGVSPRLYLETFDAFKYQGLGEDGNYKKGTREKVKTLKVRFTRDPEGYLTRQELAVRSLIKQRTP